VLPRIVVAARRDDALAKLLSSPNRRSPFHLEYCHDADLIVDRARHEPPAAVVVGLTARQSATAVSLVRRVKQQCPELPVLVACLEDGSRGRHVLNAARAGADHFAFSAIDDFQSVLRTLVTPNAPPPAGDGDEIDQVRRQRVRSSARRGTGKSRFLTRRPAAMLPVFPPSLAPMLREIMTMCSGAAPPRDVDALALRIGMPRRTLAREMTRRGWPSLRDLLMWGRLFRGAVAGLQARLNGLGWSKAQVIMMRATGYQSTRAAGRAFRMRAGVGLRDVWREGAAAILPAFLRSLGEDLPPTRMAS
jgi:ActR/RegA family two-component response regulator